MNVLFKPSLLNSYLVTMSLPTPRRIIVSNKSGGVEIENGDVEPKEIFGGVMKRAVLGGDKVPVDLRYVGHLCGMRETR